MKLISLSPTFLSLRGYRPFQRTLRWVVRATKKSKCDGDSQKSFPNPENGRSCARKSVDLRPAKSLLQKKRPSDDGRYRFLVASVNV